MQFLPSGPEDLNHDLVPAKNIPLTEAVRLSPAAAELDSDNVAERLDPLRLLRKYWLLLSALMILGAIGGFVSVVLSTPLYRTRLLLEVHNDTGVLPKDLTGGGGSDTQDNDINIQTQISILRSSSFLKRGADRMQSETVLPAPTGLDIFSRLRQRIHPATQDPVAAGRDGLYVATTTFDARPITRTRLIELTCESTSPDVAAQFLNSMAAEFQDDSARSRMTNAQRSSEWLAGQIEETKAKVQEAEEKLRDYVASSGNVFAGQDATLEDTRLAQLKGELAKIQAERIAKQSRYERTQKNLPPEQLAEILDDATLRGYQAKLEDLNRERAGLTTVYTAKHEKVRKIDAQIESLRNAYEAEVTSVIGRMKSDYESTLRQEKLLQAAYDGQSQRVGSEAAKAAQYNALKREVETQRQLYQQLLVEDSQVNMSSSVPVNPIAIREQAATPEYPYTPRPVLNIAFGTLLGAALAGGLVFVRERMDRSIKSPGISRRMFNAPELGVIPNLGLNGNGRRLGLPSALNGMHEDSATALATWQNRPAFVAESFRGTLASILRNQASDKSQKIVLVTSAGPAEGKTTVVQNLGIALAETGRRVLLVDGDFRRPHLHREFSLSNEWGLIDLLSEDQPLSEYRPERLGVFTGLPGLSILPNRISQHNVSKALYSPRLRTVLEMLAKRYDMILVDAPPLLSVADARIIAPLTDALILVLRCGVTARDVAMEAYQRIQDDGLTLLGTVLTDYDLSADRKRQYYYDYGNPSRS